MDVPGKHPSFILREPKFLNGGPPLNLLRRSLVTPRDLFFVRNHATVPSPDPRRYRLSVGGAVGRSLVLSREEIRERFPKRTLTITLQCAGNRRCEFDRVSPVPGSLPWGAEAIGTGVWGGAPLQDVLLAAEIQAGARHVEFTGLDEVDQGGDRINFGGSIPVEKALAAEVLLAYEMNGETLAPEHGFPLRVVVPGYIGARSVKWLSTITARESPSCNHFQARSYRLFPPHVRPETAGDSLGIELGEMPVNAAICEPADGAKVPAGEALIRGYALAGAGEALERVDVTADSGKTWSAASLSADEAPWAWRFWEAKLELRPGACTLAARARDSAGGTQPEDLATLWNFNGYMNNAWHRIRVEVFG